MPWPSAFDEVIQSWKPDVVHAEAVHGQLFALHARLPDRGVKKTVSIHNVERELFERIGNPPVPFARSLVQADPPPLARVVSSAVVVH